MWRGLIDRVNPKQKFVCRIDASECEVNDVLNLVVTDVVQETPRIRSYVLRDRDFESLPTFEAGAHLKVMLRTESGELVERSYSICSTSSDLSHYQIGVLREDDGRGGSLAVHRDWTEGQLVQATLPRNQFSLAEGEEVFHLFVAGGIGITPLLSMARTVAARQGRWAFHYCARSRADAAFLSEIDSLAGDRLTLHLDGRDSTQRLDVAGLLEGMAADTHIYVCGPKSLNEAVIDAAASAGWSRDRIHFEFFAEASPVSGDHSFTVHLRQSGRSVTVAGNESILDALIREGIEPIYDCKRGECGLCATVVAEGEVNHRDYVLSSDERADGRQMCICISRAAGLELTLEL